MGKNFLYSLLIIFLVASQSEAMVRTVVSKAWTPVKAVGERGSLARGYATSAIMVPTSLALKKVNVSSDDEHDTGKETPWTFKGWSIPLIVGGGTSLWKDLQLKKEEYQKELREQEAQRYARILEEEQYQKKLVQNKKENEIRLRKLQEEWEEEKRQSEYLLKQERKEYEESLVKIKKRRDVQLRIAKEKEKIEQERLAREKRRTDKKKWDAFFHTRTEFDPVRYKTKFSQPD